MSDSNSSNVELTDNCAVSNVTIGTLRRVVNLRRSSGIDTTYLTTLYGSVYPMHIDHLSREIYNTDSLPIGTKVDAVVFSSFSSDGILTYRTVSGNDTLYNAADSIDFTMPRYFTCHSYTGTSTKTYRVQINVHKVDPQDFSWNKVTEIADLSQVVKQKAFAQDGKLYLFVEKDTASYCYRSENGQTWSSSALEGSIPADVNGIAVYNGRFYGVSPSSSVVTSDDGVRWTALTNANCGISSLVATTEQRLFAIGTDGFYSSPDGNSWTRVESDASSALLPVSETTSTVAQMNFNPAFEYVLLAGKNVDGTTVLWKNTIDKLHEGVGVWSYYPATEEVRYPLPSLQSPSMIGYDDRALYVGCQNDTVSLFYVSEDAGRTWQPDKRVYVHPYGIHATSLSCVVDDASYIWLICGGSGQVWRGRINRLSFKTNQTAFTE